ncbi:MAG: protein kinase [Deltaproteobacteria bacterium]|nr:protein kinase [Deltaproteobacteria bacterium]
MSGSTPARGTPVPLLPRGRLGHYELFERFAVGDMAELYLGRARGEEGFEKLVVIKRVLPRLAEDMRFVQMLQQEARIHASLSHKNIVQIHDLGLSADGEYFIVLEYVDGRDLGALMEHCARGSRLLPGKRLDDAVSLYILGEAAEGVHFAHELRGSDGQPLGLVHRDISPSNILLSYAGEVKLSDFGVAKRKTDSSVVPSLKGELGYISPEQARGAPTDRRSDVFSLGAVAFELCTGSPLRHLSGTPDDYLKAASGIVASPQRYRPDVPPAIDRLLSAALAPDPRDRFPDARAFVLACREALATVKRPKNGEATELKRLLASLMPPDAKTEHKLPSKFISLVPNLWEDVTVPDVPLPLPPQGPRLPALPSSPAQPPPLPVAAGPTAPRVPVPSPLGAGAGQRFPRPQPADRTRRRPTSPDLRRAAQARHNLGWALLIFGALVASTLFSIHVYVMPLQVAAVYFRPAFVDVVSEPGGADVYVDGRKVPGTTPAVVEVRRDHGRHRIEVHKDGYAPAVQELRYDREVRLQASFRLVPVPRPPAE